MNKALLMACLLPFASLAQTNGAELDRARLELEVARAKLEAERARFEAEKALWEAQKASLLQPAPVATAAPAAASAIVIITNGPPEPTYMAQQATRLYRNGQIAGDLPAAAIVKGKPHPQHDKWLLVVWRGETFEAAREVFVETLGYVASLERRALTARNRVEETRRELEATRRRRGELEQQLTELETQRRQTVIFTPPPTTPPGTNRPTPVVVMTSDNASGSHSFRIRREMNESERSLTALEKQLAELREEQNRAETALARARAAVESAASR